MKHQKGLKSLYLHVYFKIGYKMFLFFSREKAAFSKSAFHILPVIYIQWRLPFGGGYYWRTPKTCQLTLGVESCANFQMSHTHD